MRPPMNPFLIAAIVAAALLGLGWIGLTIKPAPFAAPPLQSGPVETMPLPAGLPAPVERYYRTLYGDQVPVYTSVIFTGRGPMRPFGPFFFQNRFRFIHQIGRGYRHYIEMTFLGLPLLKVNERYIDGESLFELPFGTETGPKLAQAANLGMWSELANVPAALLGEGRARWEPVDAETALLFVPFEGGEQHFVVRFDPDTGLLKHLETMRYRGSRDAVKTLWITASQGMAVIAGQPVSTVGAARWNDQSAPWAVFTIESLVVNADLGDYLTAKGP